MMTNATPLEPITQAKGLVSGLVGEVLVRQCTGTSIIGTEPTDDTSPSIDVAMMQNSSDILVTVRREICKLVQDAYVAQDNAVLDDMAGLPIRHLHLAIHSNVVDGRIGAGKHLDDIHGSDDSITSLLSKA